MTDTEPPPVENAPTRERDEETPRSLIHTPDRRVRVFISSTIVELADERAAARAAIQELRQTPIIFESGARPHHPRAVYQQLLEQSDIFVGIYWQSYGWVAPDMEISGIEDEYQRSEGKPRLIYVKTPASERDAQLTALLDHIGNSGVTYKRFETSEELRDLIANDVAIALAERFAGSEGPSLPRLPHRLPLSPTPFVGRDQAVADIVNQLSRDDLRLLTLTGTGGVGKTRLALEAGRRIEGDYADGAAFVDLAPLTDSALVPSAILQALGVREEGDQPPTRLLRSYLADKELLLVLDNFEHILDGGSFVRTLLTSTSRLKVLVTNAMCTFQHQAHGPLPWTVLDPPYQGGAPWTWRSSW